MATTWREVCETVEQIVRDDIADGSLDPSDRDAVEEYAHEWADGSSWVIYYSESRALWADRATPDFEDEANEIVTPDAGIQERITAAVYLAVRAQIVETVERVADELEDADDVPVTA